MGAGHLERSINLLKKQTVSMREDILKDMKGVRSRAKANVTRIINQVNELMRDKRNLPAVVELTARLDEALSRS